MGIDHNLSVLIPTWRRPEDLVRCLRALELQSSPPVQVVVTVRDDDEVTWSALDNFATDRFILQPVRIQAGPVTAAMNAGLQETIGDLVAITDDDAEPRPDWLERISRHFRDQRVGGVGGRDWQEHEQGSKPVVGRVQWFGRVIGEHHLGTGGARLVEVLKGANCAFRGEVLREIGFDRRMLGVGTVINWELTLSFAFLARGWKLIYDPAVAVDHHAAPRHDIDQRSAFSAVACVNIVHNETLALFEYLPWWRWPIFAVWSLMIGTREAPGLAQVPRLIMKGERDNLARWRATLMGRAMGVRTYALLKVRPAGTRACASTVAEGPAT